MKKLVGRMAVSLLALQGSMVGAWAGGCASAGDASALRVAALQQELMVAAFSCHDVGRYNRFVLDHRPELIDSDANLKAYFVRRGGSDAGYHTYKTELANNASLQSSRDGDAFCARADDEFAMTDGAPNLSGLLGGRHWALAASYPTCPGVDNPVETASVGPMPRRFGRHHRYAAENRNVADDSGSARSDDVYADDDRRSDRAASGFSAPAPHRRIQNDDY